MYHGKLRKLFLNGYAYFAALARSGMALIMGRSNDLLPGPGQAVENVADWVAALQISRHREGNRDEQLADR